MTAFEEFGVLSELGKAIDEMDWNLPTDVQAEAIPLILGGGDVLMAAETGSGKTGAFCLPILQIVWETLKDIQEGKGSKVVQQVSTEWTMSFFDRTDALAVTPDGLRCQSRDPQGWHGCRATKGVHSKGAYYYEATVTDEGLCRVGWSTQAARLDLGTDRLGFGFGGTGKKSNAKQFDDYGSAYGKNDVIGCLLNLSAGEVRYTKNGEDLGVAFKLDQSRRSDCYFPAVVLKNAEISFNFGTTPFKYSPPTGSIGICQAPKENVKNNVVSAAAATETKQVNNAPQAIIIEPSRELAEQTFNQITKFKKHLENPKVRELLVVGGVNVKDQINQLNAGIDIVVGTPGRLEDLIQGGYLALTHCRFFVLDEADGLLKAGYGEMIERLHRQIPKITSDGRRLQMVVCSATLHAFEVKKMAEKLMHFPTWVDLKGEDAVPETVHHVVVIADPQKDRSWENLRKYVQTDGVHSKDNIRSGNTTPETLSEAVKLLKGEYCVRAIREHKMDRAIIFCRTKLDCDNLERYFKSFGNEFSCVCLHGDRKPQERKGNLEKFKQSQVRFLICTDVAARGIDIGGLPFMINVTLPDEKSNYVHRIGRVGRAERMGLAISIVSSIPEKVWYHGEWCSSRGRNCWNTNLIDDRPKGCCMWYNEPQYLADIEEHLNITIQQVEPDMKVPCNEFDGKVVYGEKRRQAGSGYQDHVSQMAPVVRSLQELESQTQLYYLRMHHNTDRSSPVRTIECVEMGIQSISPATATQDDRRRKKETTPINWAGNNTISTNRASEKNISGSLPNSNITHSSLAPVSIESIYLLAKKVGSTQASPCTAVSVPFYKGRSGSSAARGLTSAAGPEYSNVMEKVCGKQLTRDLSPEMSNKRMCLTPNATNSNSSESKDQLSNDPNDDLRVVIMDRIKSMTLAETTILEEKLVDLTRSPDYWGPSLPFRASPRRVAGGLRVHCSDDCSLQWLNGAISSLGKLWDDCGGFYTIPMNLFTRYIKGVVFFADFPEDLTALRNALALYNEQFLNVKDWPLFAHNTVQNDKYANHLLVFGIPPDEVEKLRDRGYRLSYKSRRLKVVLSGRLGERQKHTIIEIDSD